LVLVFATKINDKAQGTRDKAQERYKVQGPGAKQDARGKGLLNMELAWEDLL